MGKIILIIVGLLALVVIGVFVFLFRGYSTTKERVSSGQDEQNCSAITLQAPADLTKATGILYPGQYRGGDYKAHGGFRFDKETTNAIEVVAPMAAKVQEGSRYIEMGEVQYMFDFTTECGVDYRLDHLKTLSPKMQAAAETLPAAKENDSRTSRINGVKVETGETLATEVGLLHRPDAPEPNVFFDFGVYDRRQKNEKSQDPAWAAKHKEKARLAYYAVCWFELLPPADAALVKSLSPGDRESDAQSDFCI